MVDSASAIDRGSPYELTLYLKPPGRRLRRPGSAADLASLTSETVSRDDLEARREAAFALPILALRRFGELTGLDLIEIDPLRCQVHVRIPAQLVERVLGVRMALAEHVGRHFRCPASPLVIPEAIAKFVQSVVGLDERPRVRKLRPMAGAAVAGAGGLTPAAIAALYGIAGPRRGRRISRPPAAP